VTISQRLRAPFLLLFSGILILLSLTAADGRSDNSSSGYQEWRTEVIFESEDLQDAISLAVAPNREVAVAYVEYGTPTQSHISRLASAEWRHDTIDISPWAYELGVFYDQTSRLHAHLIDSGDSIGYSQLWHLWDAGDEWKSELAMSYWAMEFTDMAMGPNGEVYAIGRFVTYQFSAATFVLKRGPFAVWLPVQFRLIDLYSGGRNTTLAVDSAGEPHYTYEMGCFDNFGPLRHVERRGAKWQVQWLASPCSAVDTSLALNSADRSYVAFSETIDDETHLILAYDDGQQGRRIRVPGGENAGPSDIAIDAQDRVHLAFVDKDAGLVRYGVLAGEEWTTVVVDEEPANIVALELVVDADGQPHLAYLDQDAGLVVYATTGI